MRTMASLAPHLVRGRRTTGQGRIDLLAIIAFAVASGLLAVVLGGFHAFLARQEHIPPAVVAASQRGMDPAGTAAFWTMLAAGASVLLVIPLLTLGGAAARMGALGRDRRLATLRLLGATPGEVVWLTALETMLQALAGALLGLIAYLVTLPAWALVTFQGQALSASEMLLPIGWLAILVLGVIALAGLSAVLGLRQVRISPLGVARQAGRPRLRLGRALATLAVIMAWMIGAPLLMRQQEMALVIGVVLVFLAVFMGIVNLIGPLLLQAMGRLMARSGSPDTLLAARRLLADPRAAWRSVSGLAGVGFIGGSLLAMPSMDPNDRDPLTALLAHDLPVGSMLTVGIAFAVAAASTSLNQAAAVLDRRGALVNLDHLGAPRSLFDRVRTREVLAPTALAAVGSAGLAVSFFLAMGVGSDLFTNVGGLVTLAVMLVSGLALVWVASLACRPVLRGVLAGAGPRIE